MYVSEARARADDGDVRQRPAHGAVEPQLKRHVYGSRARPCADAQPTDEGVIAPDRERAEEQDGVDCRDGGHHEHAVDLRTPTRQQRRQDMAAERTLKSTFPTTSLTPPYVLSTQPVSSAANVASLEASAWRAMRPPEALTAQ